MSQDDNLKHIVEESKKDPEAFVKVYDLFFNKIYGYVYYKVGSVEDAEDITEQVFLKALVAIGKFKWEGAFFSSWLFKIAHNQIVDYFRARAKTVNNKTVNNIPDEQMDKIPDKGECLERIVETKMSLSYIQNEILKLTKEQQDVLILKFLSGFSNMEIAKFLNKTEGAVKALQHRALNSLRKILKERY
ncbi:sigma-70 family RNA polymerase sigma factor [Candidatus Oleimmundimicrobium sp.]|uniref:RNA polymerase sigma factor n=1 Tax=Candidatus Oleimmundimicrobium sp. TaxID=3060597 RepID=UPI0027246894|nr:sigma-70 family RNA polymerase sigma factor [Candidatus Oleimmundimicrobium sp.]MDO8885388.1 sigma-70 family RNA polymerase sigma factor [Candidatus Oleimmundimicrobium sp.]